MLKPYFSWIERPGGEEIETVILDNHFKEAIVSKSFAIKGTDTEAVAGEKWRFFFFF